MTAHYAGAAFTEREARWIAQAACADSRLPQWMWDSDAHAHPEAVAVCQTCPVRAECLADALSAANRQYDSGVRGGLSVMQRDELRRRANRRAS